MRNGNGVYAYKNGVFTDSDLSSGWLTNQFTVYRIGASPSGFYSNGNLTSIKIYNKAISNTSKKRNLYFSKKLNHIKNMSLSEISSLEKKKTNVSLSRFIKVQCLCIDELINKFNYIDFIKIDIEGHEYKIIPSLTKNINKIKKIFCEINGSTHREEFKKDFQYCDTKLKNLKNKKFIYW